MTPALPTASSAYGLKGPSADATVDNATSAGLHLSPWKSCPNKRGQLSLHTMKIKVPHANDLLMTQNHS